jgi:predicted amidophosphoribosyltransferase
VGAVPLHRWRLWKRGYNQALLIARGVAEEAGLDCVPDLIERTRATPTLRGLGTRERRQAVRDAFRVPARHRQALAGRVVLLVDDVFTSGATAEACARALKGAGAREVRLLCWARVLREEGAAR